MRLKLVGIAFLAVLSSLFLTSAAFAQQSFDLQRYLGSNFNVDALAQFLFPGLPAEWLRVPQVIWYVILPFIAVFTVIYGLLRELRIFRYAPNKVNIVLAFAMAMLLLPSGVLTFVVVNLYAFGAAFGAIAFFVVFMIGIVFWGLATSWRMWGEVDIARAYAKSAQNLRMELRGYENRRVQIIKSLATANAGEREHLQNEMAKIQERELEIEKRLRAIRMES